MCFFEQFYWRNHKQEVCAWIVNVGVSLLHLSMCGLCLLPLLQQLKNLICYLYSALNVSEFWTQKIIVSTGKLWMCVCVYVTTGISISWPLFMCVYVCTVHTVQVKKWLMDKIPQMDIHPIHRNKHTYLHTEIESLGDKKGQEDRTEETENWENEKWRGLTQSLRNIHKQLCSTMSIRAYSIEVLSSVNKCLSQQELMRWGEKKWVHY